MTTKDRLHQAVDAMSEQEAADALDYIVSRGRDPLAVVSTPRRSMTSR